MMNEKRKMSDIEGGIKDMIALVEKQRAEIAKLREARDLIADWIVEGTDDLPDDTPVTIKIGSRSIIFDELKNLRATLEGGEA